MGARLAGLGGLVGDWSAGAMANWNRMKRIGGGNRRGPGCANWRKNLHQRCNQDDRQKFFQPPAHQPVLPPANQSCTESGVEFRFPTIPKTALFLAQVPQEGRHARAAPQTFGLRLQPVVAQCRSFRKVLEI
jgi:hypothetical protein